MTSLSASSICVQRAVTPSSAFATVAAAAAAAAAAAERGRNKLERNCALRSMRTRSNDSKLSLLAGTAVSLSLLVGCGMLCIEGRLW